MLFNSFEYIFLFLPFTFFIYFFLNKKRVPEISKAFLIFASLFFYSWWNIIYLPLILSSLFINYVIGLSLIKDMTNSKITKKQLLIFGILFNLGLLGYFKYADFFLINVNFLFGSDVELLHLVLPLAISFFTFQQIAYLIDSYRGETKESDFLNYAIFVTFFPQLIAGPIVHHKEMMPQFANIRTKIIHYKNIVLGLFIFSIGLFKKVVIADSFAVWANHGFDVATNLNFLEAWGALLAYSFQLYFDFSGYTDMAIGVALLFNIKLPINFNSPYKSTSIIEMWERWHITLSRFINKYVFKSIVKLFTKYTFAKGMLAVFLSMIISGLWHGASWMFVFFGAIHGFALVTNHLWKRKIKIKLPIYLGWFLTFNTWNFALIFFRSNSWEDAEKMLRGILGFNGISTDAEFITLMNYIDILPATIVAFIIILLTKNSNQLVDSFDKHRIRFYFLSIFCFGVSLVIMSLQTGTEFLYFNF